MRGRTTVRAIALLSASSLAIHQLRYAIGYGDGAPHALAQHPHAYMSALLPATMAVALAALAAALTRIARGRASRPGPSLLTLWLAATMTLAAVYGFQETVEGAGAIAGGGWIGLALAIPAGFLVALALRGADAAEVRPFALLRIRAFGSLALLAAPYSLPTRITDTRLRARAPPLRSLV